MIMRIDDQDIIRESYFINLMEEKNCTMIKNINSNLTEIQKVYDEIYLNTNASLSENQFKRLTLQYENIREEIIK